MVKMNNAIGVVSQIDRYSLHLKNTNGNTKRLDALGKFIHAHRGQILYEFNSIFYLIGTTQKENQNAGCTSEARCELFEALMLWEFDNEIFHNIVKPRGK